MNRIDTQGEMTKNFIIVIMVCIVLFGIFMKFSNPKPDQVLEYRKIDELSLKLHFFKVQDSKNSGYSPALLLFHGGGWQYGNPSMFYRQCKYFSRKGINCISAEYRIESLHGTDPRAAIDDAVYVLNFLEKHARELQIDSERIAVGGGSSGGHLAATLGIPVPLLKHLTYERPKALVLYNPMLDLSPGHPDHELVSDFWKEVSPLQYVDEKTPDTLIMVGTEDSEVPLATVRKFCSKMQNLGQSCQLETFEGAKHGFFNFNSKSPDYFHKTNSLVLTFLRERGF